MLSRTLLAAALAASAATSALAQVPSLTACVEQSEPAALPACQSLAQTIASDVDLECVVLSGCRDPDGPLSTGQVDVILDVDGGQLYEVAKAVPSLVIVSEEHEGSTPGGEVIVSGYFPVALVTNEFCDSGDASFASLEGARICSTGYQKTAGWRASVGTLLSDGIIPPIIASGSSVPNDINSVDQFFASGCVPGVSDEAGASNPLCANCIGPDTCSLTDAELYSNYGGALRCLAEGAGDVAFVKMTTPATFLNMPGDDNSFDPSWNYVNGDSLDDYKLLCLQGGCQPVDQFQGCSFPRAIAHTVIASSNDAGVIALRGALEAASADPQFQADFLTPGGQYTGLIFDAAATYLAPVNESLDSFAGALFSSWSGLDALNAL